MITYFLFTFVYIPSMMFNNISLENQFSNDIIIGIEYNNFNIEGGITTFMDEDNIVFFPYQNDYWIGMNYNFKNIIISFKHECYHPVISSFEGMQYTGGSNKLSITYDSRKGD